jgi:organic hydroperoxide reductase OsmC/OhrA
MKNLRVKVTGKYLREGSLLRGDARSFADSCQIEVSLDSDEPAERIAQLIKEAEASCFTIGALRNPTPVDLVAAVNGKSFDLEKSAPA